MGGDSTASEMSFRRSFQELPAIFRFIDGFFAMEAIDGKHRDVVHLAVEEIFTNMVKYHPGHQERIVIALRRNGPELAVSLTDFDVDRFDPTQRPDVDVTLPLEQRRPGGLGLHLTKVMMDRVEYAYENRRGTTTLYKTLE